MSREGIRLLDVAYVVFFVAIATIVTWRSFHASNVAVPGRDRLHQDFDDTIYFPIRAVAAGVNPYESGRDNPNEYMNLFPVTNHFPLYSPLLFAVFGIFAVPPLLPATAIYMLTNEALLVLFSWLTLAICNRNATISRALGLSALLLLTLPVRSTIHWGQVTLALNLVLLLAIHWGDRCWRKSAIMVFLSTIKITFGGPAGLLLAARGDIKSSTSGIIVGGLVGGLGLVLTFAHANQASWEHVSKVIYENQRHFHSDPFYVTTTNPLRIEAAAGFEYAFGTEFSRAGSTTIGVLILFTACFALWKSRPQATIPEHAASTRSALLILTVFLCIYHQLPEYLLPIVPLVACLSCAHSSWRILPPILRVAFSLLLLVPFVNVSQTHSFQRFFAAVFSSAIHEGSSLEFFSRLASSANSLSVFIAWLILTFYLLFRSQAGFERNQMV